LDNPLLRGEDALALGVCSCLSSQHFQRADIRPPQSKNIPKNDFIAHLIFTPTNPILTKQKQQY
jgi:hypothetical protein